MQPVKDSVAILPVGAIIYHQPRDHYYRIMNKTMIKKEDGGWEYGWCYAEVEKIDSNTYCQKKDAEIFSRPFSMFDSDWFLAY